MSVDEHFNNVFKQLPEHPDIECNSDGFVRWKRDKKEVSIYYRKDNDVYNAYYYESMPKVLNKNPKLNGPKRSCAMITHVGKLFVDNPNNFKFVRTKDGDNSNYSASNLEWVKSRKKVIKNIYEDDN